MLGLASPRALLTLAFALTSVYAQANDDAQCVSLRGSSSCPAFQDAYINPTNLSQAWPWFTAVNDVATFDQQFELYFTDPNRYHQTKFERQLQCNSTAAQNTTLQYQRTILCGQFSQISYSVSCNLKNRANPIMVCQDTCLQYAQTENVLVANPQICPPANQLTLVQNTTREFNLNKDYVTCTDWSTLVSSDNATCVEGIMNEGNCGWGPQVNNQLCAHCDPTGNQTIPACCTDAKTDLSQCSLFGFPGAARVRPTTSVGTTMVTSTGTSANPTSTSSPTNNTNNGQQQRGKRYTGGQVAGIVVGCIIGALLLGLLLGLLCFRRKNNNNNNNNNSNNGSQVDAASARQDDLEKTRMLNNNASSDPRSGAAAGAGAGLAGVGLGAAAAAGRSRGDEKDGGWSSPFRDEKTGSPAFGEKEVARPGSSALGSILNNGAPGTNAAAPSAMAAAAPGAQQPHSNAASVTGGRFSPSSSRSGVGAGVGAAAAGLGAGALLGAGAARASSGTPTTNSNSNSNPASNRAASSTPTQMAGLTAGSSSENRPMSALSNSTTDGRGTTVPAVRDQYSGLDIQPNDEVVAIYPYSATLTDEINLEVDDVVNVVRLYDDGWALGRRTAGPGIVAAEGAFPLVCVTHASAVDGPASRGMGGSLPGATSSDDDRLTSGDGGISDSVDGAVTADEGALTADEDFEPSRRR
ncbi:unnamed protein product [Tilletia controversa]|nr:unnamed protein product [Tilletia controversa]CAD6980707.1 unnamed protein product [Tilletia controversa]